MKKCKQMKVVAAATPAEFERSFNEAMQELADKDPVYELRETGGSLWAVITFEQEFAETVADEYRLQGMRYFCYDCPLHDGMTDGRRRLVSCQYADLVETRYDRPACEVFYRKLMNGSIEPVDKRGKEVRYR